VLLERHGRAIDRAPVLQKNLDEEKAADQTLTTLAEKSVRRKAT
jgi:ferritin-like metal-binding protein YciE